MIDDEFYQSPEDWPQPPDESCTLDASVHSTARARKTKGLSKKERKKLSQSLAGVTAAAVTVVMLSGTLPQLALPGLDIPDLKPVAGSDNCPLCGIQDCPYYIDDQDCYGLSIIDTTKPDFLDADDISGMPGFTLTDDSDMGYIGSAVTPEGHRLVFQMSDMNIIDDNELFNTVWYSEFRGENNEYQYTGYLMTSEDNASQRTEYLWYGFCQGHTGAVQVPTPEILRDFVGPEEIDFSGADAVVLTRDVPGFPEIQLQVLTNSVRVDPQVFLDSMQFYESDFCRQSLGQTMYLTETDRIYRIYEDNMTYGVRWNDRGYYYDMPTRYILEHDFAQKWFELECHDSRYIHQWQLSFCVGGWDRILSRWNQLNEDAPKFGHEVHFPLKNLGQLHFNGITYDCWLSYRQDSQGALYSGMLYLVPLQETMVSVQIDLYSDDLIDEVLTAGAIPRDGALYDDLAVILNQITLK